MKKAITLTLLSLAAASFSTAAVTFDFTSAEGFTSAALNGQQGWTATAGILVNVDPTKEFLFVNGGGQNAVYGGSSLNPQAGTMTYTQDFKFNYNRDATEDVYNVFKLDSDSEIARVFFKYSISTGDFFLRYSTGNGFDQNTKSSASFSPTAIGMADSSDLTTDDLRLTWNLTRGVDAASWSIDVVLENLTTASVVDLNTSAGATTWATTVTVNNGFHTDTSILHGFSAPGGALTNANIYSISAVPEPTTVALWTGFCIAGLVMLRRRQLEQ